MANPQNLGEEPDSKNEATGADEKTSAPAGQDEGVTSAKPGAPNAELAAGSSAQSNESQATKSVPADSDAAAEVGTSSVNAPGEELDMNAFEEESRDSNPVKAFAKITELGDQLAHVHADLYNLNQEYSNYMCRSKGAASGHRESGQSEVLKALIDILDDIDTAYAHDDLDDGPFASIASKFEPIFDQRLFLERFGQEDEDFDPAFHETLLANTNPEANRPIVAKVLQPDYHRAKRILRAAKVMVDNLK